MFRWLKALKDYFDPPQSGLVVYKYYERTGECHSCGMCCSGIHLVHNEEAITDEAEFARLQKHYTDYLHFTPVGRTDAGLTFRCKHLTEDKRCAIHDDRPLFCKKYPSETTLLFGGNLAEACGFRFRPKTPFAHILQKTAQKSKKASGRLLFDVFRRKEAHGLGEGRILPANSARPAVDDPAHTSQL